MAERENIDRIGRYKSSDELSGLWQHHKDGCLSKDNDEPKKHLDSSALKALKLHPWPGNIREFHNVIILAAYGTEGDTISESDLDISESAPTPETSLLLKDPDKDRDRIIEAYRREGSWIAAAKLLKISKRAILEWRKRHGINKKGQVES